MDFWLMWTWGCLFSMVIMFSLWLIYLRNDRPDIVDVGWGFVILFLGVGFSILSDGWPFRRYLLAFVVAIWAGRLGIYLFIRWRGSHEDGRYKSLRALWSSYPRISFLLFFMLQAAFASLLMLPALAIARNPDPQWMALEWVAVSLFILATLGESMADAQLARFKSQSTGKENVCELGLWRYSRHPNYFFQWLAWFALGLWALSAGWGWLSWVSPFVMYLLLTRFSGIPPAEAQSLKSRGAAYRRYQQTTNAFFPWFPKSI